MSAAFNVGEKVQVDVDGAPYCGTIITYDDSSSPVTYKVSVWGKGEVDTFEESDIIALS